MITELLTGKIRRYKVVGSGSEVWRVRITRVSESVDRRNEMGDVSPETCREQN